MLKMLQDLELSISSFGCSHHVECSGNFLDCNFTAILGVNGGTHNTIGSIAYILQQLVASIKLELNLEIFVFYLVGARSSGHSFAELRKTKASLNVFEI